MAGSGGHQGVKHRTGLAKLSVLANPGPSTPASYIGKPPPSQSGIDNLRGSDLLFQRAPGLSVERTLRGWRSKTGR